MKKEENRRHRSVGPGRPLDLAKGDAVLRAAMKLFMQRGLAGVTLDEIARSAGVTKPTIYKHFGSKDELFSRCVRRKCEGLTGEEVFARLSGVCPQKDLCAVGYAFMDLIYSPDALALHRIMMLESESNSEMSRLFYEAGPSRLIDRLAAYLGHVEESHDLSFPDKRVAAKQFLSLFTGEMQLRVLLRIPPRPTKEDFQEFARNNVLLFLRGYQLPRAKAGQSSTFRDEPSH